MPLTHHFLQKIVNVRWGGEIDQQGLLAEYPPGAGAPDFENISEVMSGTPTAYALDSGQSFEGINMGASGLGFTVLTAGLVCFGTPKDGEACFIACPGFKYTGLIGAGDALKRGALNENEDLIWTAMASGGTGKLVALTFALDAFFAVYVEDENTTIATSTDGESWTSASAFPSVLPVEQAHGGAVAAVVKADPDNPEGPPLKTYIAAGDITQDDSEFRNFVLSLMWATSSTGTAWATTYNPGMTVEPGTSYDIIENYACTIAGGPISKDRQVFVAAAATKTLIENPLPDDLPYVQLTAAAAFSENGASWDTIKLPGALEATIDQFSWGLAVTHVRTKDGEGYFLLSDHEYIGGLPGHPTPNSNLYKSSDGQSWENIRTNINWMSTLSAIAKDLDKTTIVRI